MPAICASTVMRSVVTGRSAMTFTKLPIPAKAIVASTAIACTASRIDSEEAVGPVGVYRVRRKNARESRACNAGDTDAGGLDLRLGYAA